MNDRIQSLRKQKNLSQKFVAAEIGVSQSTMSGYETGYSTPDVQTLAKIARVLGTSVDYLSGMVDTPDFVVQVTDEDPQILEIKEYFKKMNAQGIQLVVEYADVLSASGRYPKKPSR